jgi:hypothetical protein
LGSPTVRVQIEWERHRRLIFLATVERHDALEYPERSRGME